MRSAGDDADDEGADADDEGADDEGDGAESTPGSPLFASTVADGAGRAGTGADDAHAMARNQQTAKLRYMRANPNRMLLRSLF